MWVAVLTAAPERGLSGAEIDRAARELGAAEVRRLGPEAAEMTLAAPASVEIPGVDVNLVPAEGREKRLLVADMDSTIITCECIDEIAAAAGVKDQIATVTERAMAGEIDFETALADRVALLSGLAEGALGEVYDRAVRLSPGAATLVRTMAARGAHTALVSGGFTFFTERVAAAAGFSEHRANTLLAEGGALTGRVADPVLGRAAKREILAELTDRLGIGPSEVVAVGDGANDIAMIETAGLGVGYRPKPALAAVADAVLIHSPLTALLHLQGIPRGAFVET